VEIQHYVNMAYSVLYSVFVSGRVLNLSHPGKPTQLAWTVESAVQT
jgi:hypothetical protein